MEDHHYLQHRHYAGRMDMQQYHQASMVCMPQIKVESDSETYNCHMSQYNSDHINPLMHRSTNPYKDNVSGSSSYPSVLHHTHTLSNNMSHLNNYSSISPAAARSNEASVICLQENHVSNIHHQTLTPCNRVDQDQRVMTPCNRVDQDQRGIQQSVVQLARGNSSQEENEDEDDDHDEQEDCGPINEYSTNVQNPLVKDEDCLVKKKCTDSNVTCLKVRKSKIEEDETESDRKETDHSCEQSRSSSPVNTDEEIIDDPPAGLSVKPDANMPSRSTSKPQACKVCGKVLSSASSYYVHMKLHSGSKPYACTMCEAAFCRKPYLEVHMRTHTGERPFQCDMCYKRFTQKSSLNTHKRVHTGERPYSCDICQKKFAVKSYVTAHRWSHVSEKPLGCQRCGLTFTSKNLFALHIRTHIDQNHECHICGRTFMKDSYLIRHQNRVHREPASFYSESSELRSDINSPSPSPPSRATCLNVDSTNSSPAGSPLASSPHGEKC